MTRKYWKAILSTMEAPEQKNFKKSLHEDFQLSVPGFSTLYNVKEEILASALAKLDEDQQRTALRNVISQFYPETLSEEDYASEINKFSIYDGEDNYALHYGLIPAYLAMYALTGKEDSSEAGEMLKEAEHYADILKTLEEEPDPIEMDRGAAAFADLEEKEQSHRWYPADMTELCPATPEEGWYIGFFNVASSDFLSFLFYNYYPLARVDAGGKPAFIEDTRDKFPTHGNIQISYDVNSNNASKEMAQQFHDGHFYALRIDDADIDKAINKARVDIKALPSGKRKDLWTIGYYNVVEPYYETVDFGRQNNIRVAAEGIGDGERVFLLYGGCLFGPFTLTYSQADSAYFVHTGIAEKKFILKAYKPAEGSIEASLQGTVRYDPTLEENVSTTFVCLADGDFVEQNRDFIPDDVLLKDYFNFLQSASEDAENADQAGSFVESDLSGFSEREIGIRMKRLERIRAYLTDRDRLQDLSDAAFRDIVTSLTNFCADSQYANQLVSLLSGDSRFMNAIQKTQVIREQIKKTQAELDELEKKKANVDEEVQKQIDGKSEKSRMLDEEISQKRAEKEKIEAEILTAQNVQTLIEAKTALNKELEGLKEEKKKRAEEIERLNDKAEGMLTRLSSAAENVDIAFDPLISGKLMEAAEGFRAGKEEEELNEGTKTLQNIYAAGREKTDELKGEKLVSYLFDKFKKYRTYEHDDFVNFMICLVQSRITVFSGAPGTGKTSVCNILGHILGLDSFDRAGKKAGTGLSLNRYIPVSVERGWTSKRNLIGYYNTLGKCFNASNPRLYSALRLMNREVENRTDEGLFPYLVLLDEANLSPMEYYWADFMNLCDDMTGTGLLNLSENMELNVSPALRFVATINNDETTERLSPRMIDRAFIVTMPGMKEAEVQPLDFADAEYTPIPFSALQEAFLPGESRGMPDASWKKIRDVFKEQGMPISPRVQLAVQNYCSAANRLFYDDDMRTKRALDYAVAQKILPKISGSGEEYRKFLEDLKEVCKSNLEKCYNILGDIIDKGEKNMNYYEFF